MYFVLAIIQNSWKSALLPKISALIGLSVNCIAARQYLISRRALKAAYKLCNGYCRKSFAEDYHRSNSVVNALIKNLECGYCGRCWREGGVRLRACEGCMIMVYCGKSCQKRDWKFHKADCDMSWEYLYPALKKCIFDPLK